MRLPLPTWPPRSAAALQGLAAYYWARGSSFAHRRALDACKGPLQRLPWCAGIAERYPTVGCPSPDGCVRGRQGIDVALRKEMREAPGLPQVTTNSKFAELLLSCESRRGLWTCEGAFCTGTGMAKQA